MHTTWSGPEAGPTVVLLHGGGVAGWMWDSLRRDLEPSHRVVVPDLPGHGGSADETYVSHSATVDALAPLLAPPTVRPTTVVGFSLGAQLAVELASRHPELVDQVVVVSAQAKQMPLSGLALRAVAVTAPLARRPWFARLQARELFVPPHLLDDYVRTSTGISRDTLLAAVGSNLRFQVPPAWSDFPGRALVMVGARERRLMRDSAALVHAARPGTELETVGGCGHGIPLQRPEWFGARIGEWASRTQ